MSKQVQKHIETITSHVIATNFMLSAIEKENFLPLLMTLKIDKSLISLVATDEDAIGANGGVD